jgi:hypothetical protein
MPKAPARTEPIPDATRAVLPAIGAAMETATSFDSSVSWH